MTFLKASIIFVRLNLKSFSCASVYLGNPGLVVAENLGSGDIALCLVDCVPMLSFRHLVFPGVSWIIMMAARLLRGVE